MGVELDEYLEAEYEAKDKDGLDWAFNHDLTSADGNFFGSLFYIFIGAPLIFIVGTAFFAGIATVCILSVVGWLLIPFVAIGYIQFLGGIINGFD